MRAAIADVPGLVDVAVEQLVNVPQVVVRVDRHAAAGYGLSPGEAAEAAGTAWAAIKAAATSLLDTSVTWPPEAQQELLTAIDEETDRLTLMVSNLLDLSRKHGVKKIVMASTGGAVYGEGYSEDGSRLPFTAPR